MSASGPVAHQSVDAHPKHGEVSHSSSANARCLGSITGQQTAPPEDDTAEKSSFDRAANQRLHNFSSMRDGFNKFRSFSRSRHPDLTIGISGTPQAHRCDPRTRVPVCERPLHTSPTNTATTIRRLSFPAHCEPPWLL